MLTPAEWEVLAGVRDELSNREIAERRGCDLETVRFHLRNIRRKLGVGNRDELAVFPGRSVDEQRRGRAARRGGRVREQIPLVQIVDMLDLLKAELAKPDPIRPVLAQIEDVLGAGHAVWVVGKLPLTAGPAPEPLGVAPHRQHGWAVGAWEANWARRTAHFLASQGAHGTPQRVAPHERVQPLERARLTRFARP